MVSGGVCYMSGDVWLCLVVTGVCLVVCVSGACHMLIIILQFLVQARGPYSRTCALVLPF